MFIPKRLVITSGGRATVPSSVRGLGRFGGAVRNAGKVYIQNGCEAVALSCYEIENDRQIVMHIP